MEQTFIKHLNIWKYCQKIQLNLNLFGLILLISLAFFPCTNAFSANAEVQKDRKSWQETFLESKEVRQVTGEDTTKLAQQREAAEEDYKQAEKEFNSHMIEYLQELVKIDAKRVPAKLLDTFNNFWKETWENTKDLVSGNPGAIINQLKTNISTAAKGTLDLLSPYLNRLGNAVDLGQAIIFNNKGDQIKDIKADFKFLYQDLPADELNAMLKKLDEWIVVAQKYEQNLAFYKSFIDTNGKPTYIYTDPRTGQEVVFMKDGDELIVTKGNSSGCTPMAAKMAETKSCLFCPLFEVIYKAADTMAATSYAKMGRPMAMIMLIGLAIYIAFKVMVLTSGFVKQDAPKFITETLTQSFKILVAYILLYNGQQIYIYAISPVLGAGLEFGTAILSEGYSKYVSSCGGGGNYSTGMLGGALYAKLVCFIQGVQAEIYIPQAVGSSLMCVAFGTAAKIQNFIPNFSMVFVGLIIWAFAWLVMLAFGFYLIDATIRIGIVGALMPFLIATWPFKATAKYASTGWGMLLNTFFVYAFLGIVIAVNVTLMKVSLGDADSFNKIIELMNGDNLIELKEKLDIGFSGFLVLIIGCLFGFKLTAQSSALAGSFAGGAGPDLAPKIGGLMASGATGAGKWVGGKTLKGGKKALETIGVGKRLRNARDGIKRGVSRAVSGVFGGGNPSKSSTKPATPITSPNAGSGFMNNQNPKQQGDNTQQQQTSGTGGTNPNNGAPTPNNNAPQGGNLSPQDNVDNAVNAGPRGSQPQAQAENLQSQQATPASQAEIAQQEKLNKESLALYKNSRDSKSGNDRRLEKAQAEYDKAGKSYENSIANAPDSERASKMNAMMESGKNVSYHQQRADDANESMRQNALNAYAGKKKSEAMKSGESFDEKETMKYATENFDEVLKELDSDLGKEE